MKKFVVGALCACMVSSLLTGCGSGASTGSVDNSSSGGTSTATVADSDKIINVWAFTDEVPGMIEKYIEEHPDFGYDINTTIIATTDGAYQPALDQALASGGSDAPDIYCAEAAFVLKYTQGDAAQYATPYEELGIDVDQAIKDADIAQYTVDIGTNADGKVVGLGYQATGGAFIYRRSIAKDVWGTDDPAVIQDKIGPGWDKFFDAAAELKAKGYGIVSGDGDIWHAVENSSDNSWIVDGKLNIIAFSLIIGGSLGNLIDRIVRDYVVDFISIKLGSYNFPIFNIADTLIVVGVFLLLIGNTGGNKNDNR